MDKKIELIDSYLRQYLKPVYPKSIYEAMAYSVFAGGKRMRPVLTLSFCENLGGDVIESMPFAIAIEMIHTYSLIHDDLPALDNDNFRRGKPTNHVVFGEATAILAGDALLNKAYEIMADECANKCSEKTIKAMKVIADAAGVKGMIGGQVVDLESENKKISLDTLLYIHENKTAALIKASILSGAYIAGADSDIVNTLTLMGSKLGTAFQIKDDILDVEGDFALLGKPIGSDNKNEKITYVTYKGLQQAKDDFEKLNKEIFELYGTLGIESKVLESYLEYLAGRSY